MNTKHIVIDRRKALAGLAAVPLLVGLPRGLRADEEGVTLTADERGLLPGDRTQGAQDAPAVLIEYASMSCPHCARFHTTLLPEVKKDWVEQGKLLYVYRDFPLNAPALWGAMLAQCLEGDAYFAFVDMIYKQQKSWLQAEEPAVALFELSQIAGFDKDRFEACLNDQETFDRLVAGIQYAEATYGVDSTPTLILNGQKIQPSNYEELSGLIAESQGS